MFILPLYTGLLGRALTVEMGPTKLRQQTVFLARNAYYFISMISDV